jgi:hypothetical protein
MKLRESNFTLETNGEFSTTDFKIEGRYKNKVLWMLINQYRHKVRTPVQEIISNARDAQRENGNPDTPIKIQLPTRLENTFKVRDYGVGMDEERVKKVFTSFGASTKNADNEQTGGFGIGAKSPLTYTDQFNIKTYVNGTYWYYVVAKTDNEGIAIHLLAKGQTDEPNGTEVQIPVNSKDVKDFVKSACRCTMFWDIQPEFNLEAEELYKLTGGIQLDNVGIYSENELAGLYNSDIIVSVDGIPYEIDYDTKRKVDSIKNIDNKLSYRTKAVIKLNVGDIDLLQTRESIDETEYTLSQLQKYGFKAFNDIEEYIASCLNAKDLQGRIEQYKTLFNSFDGIQNHRFAEVFNLTSRSLSLSSNLEFSGYAFKGKWGSRVKTPQKKDNKFFNGYRGANFEYTELNNFYWDDLKDTESSNQKARRLRHCLTQLGSGQVVVIVQGKASNFEYVRTLRMLGAKKLSSLPLPPKKKPTYTRNSAGKRVKKPVEVISIHTLSNDGTRTAEDIKLADISTKFVYADYSEGMDSKWIVLIKKFTEFTPILLSKSNAKKIKGNTSFITLDSFKSNYKASQGLIDAVARFSLTYDNNLSYDVKEFLRSEKNTLRDKRLVKAIDIVYNKSRQIIGSYQIPKEIYESIHEEVIARKKSKQKTINVAKKVIESYEILRYFHRVNNNRVMTNTLNQIYKAKTVGTLPR